MTNYKLIYFNAKSRAEIIRLIFILAGVKFDDFRIEMVDWPKYKPDMLFYQVPVLEVDGEPLAQTGAIAMYLADKYNLTGENNWEKAKVEELIGLGNDMVTFAEEYFLVQDDTKKKEAMVKFEKDRLIPIFKRLNEILAKNGTGYFVGNKLTAADLDMFHIVDWFSHDFPDSLNGFDQLKEFHKKIGAVPAIKKWLETRPKTPF